METTSPVSNDNSRGRLWTLSGPDYALNDMVSRNSPYGEPTSGRAFYLVSAARFLLCLRLARRGGTTTRAMTAEFLRLVAIQRRMIKNGV